MLIMITKTGLQHFTNVSVSLFPLHTTPFRETPGYLEKDSRCFSCLKNKKKDNLKHYANDYDVVDEELVKKLVASV